jgi:hypothetical protein
MPQMPQISGLVVVERLPMITFLAAVASLISLRLRSRDSLDLEVASVERSEAEAPRSCEALLTDCSGSSSTDFGRKQSTP